MPLEMGRLGSIIKASPAPCLVIHFSHLLLQGKQVSVKPLLVLFILQIDFKAQQNFQLLLALFHAWLCLSWVREEG